MSSDNANQEVDKLYKIRHSLAHVLAQAILVHFPEALLSTGPVVENGFYYDIDFGTKTFSDTDFEKIEAEMRNIISRKLAIIKKAVIGSEAIEMFKSNPYKSEIINDLAERKEEITLYYTGDEFYDLCRGGHVDNLSEIATDSFKLDKIAGAYFKADANNKQLTRIYGLAFETKDSLDKYIWQQEEAKKRDHRVLGRQLKIYTISDLVGSGLPLFHKNGQILRRELTEYLWSLHKDYDYSWVTTPHLAKESLFETSGHSKHYLDDMFSVFGGTSKEKFYVKPMSCPMHMELFKDNKFSYRDMPQRYFEPAVVYRDEKTGQLSGLTRVRSITQDDGHIFCRVDGIKTEIRIMLEILKKFYKTMGMDNNYKVSLSTRNMNKKEVFLGSDEVWEKAEGALKEICMEEGLPYYEAPGDAAFYGPKLDFVFKDAIGRDWQLATIQCDFNLPNRFDLSFVNEKGEKEQPVVIHRAISGSLERFIGVAIEHFAGSFPVWLSPVQVTIVAVKQELHAEYADSVYKKLKEAGVRVEIDDRNESLGKRIRAAKDMKVPYVIVIGDKEKESSMLTIETRGEKIEGMSVEDFTNKIQTEIKDRILN
jgi:threonyl-tRNA synthetase